MELTGKLFQILPEVQGESQRGPWIRGGFVVETDSDVPRKVAFTAFGEERVNMVRQLQPGQLVQVTFNPESREYQGRWYTDLRATNVHPFVPGQMPVSPATGYAWTGVQQQAQGVPAQPAAAPQPQPAAFAQAPQMPSTEDDLPF